MYDFINRNPKNEKLDQPGSDEYFQQVEQHQPQKSQQQPQQDEWAEYRRR